MKKQLQTLWRKFGFQRLETEVRIGTAFSRAAATAAARSIDPALPRTWEFSGFSQHGEDGIVDYLCSKLLAPNLHFFEIGSANGLENCTAWLALARGYAGVMVEGSSDLSKQCEETLRGRVWNIQTVNLMVNVENVSSLMKACPHPDPDVFVIDIDSMDYYVLKRILELNYRPKLILAEYNSVFGPEMAVTVSYQSNFDRWQMHPSGLYYGVSIAAWRKLLAPYGYQFVTVDSSGCNAFFIDPAAFPKGFSSTLRGIDFLDNIGDSNGATNPYRDSRGDLVVPKRQWSEQLKIISALPLVEV